MQPRMFPKRTTNLPGRIVQQCVIWSNAWKAPGRPWIAVREPIANLPMAAAATVAAAAAASARGKRTGRYRDMRAAEPTPDRHR